MLTLPARPLVFAQAIVLGLVSAATAQVPAGYYDTAIGTGATLKSQLHDIIDGHQFRSYGEARLDLQVTDVDPSDPDRMLLVYNSFSLDVSVINPFGGLPGWDSGRSWNREHTWPQSRGVGGDGNDHSDLHQLRPSNPSVNSNRGNRHFGGDFGQSFGAVSGGFWYPGDEDAGMIARQMFYMAVRYDGSDSNTVDLEISNYSSGNASGANIGNLDNLLDWHYQAGPDDFERNRNDVIYEDYQGNRNPFIDRPEFVWSVFVDQANDTQLTVGGPSAIDLGRVYAGGSTPAMPSVTLNKAGVDGTYYGVTTTGLATSTAGDNSRPLAMGSGVSDSFNVGLDVTTSQSGVFGGSVVIDNLDVTTGGGSGRGANDADDTIDLSFTVLDQPVASFAADSILSATTIDFGQIGLGAGFLEETLTLFNYDGAGGPNFASDLDLDGFTAVGDDSVFSLDTSLFAGIAQGDGLTFDALFDTSIVGDFEATYTIDLSGEDLPGEQSQTLSLTLLGEVVGETIAGDYNGDGSVNAIDYAVYRDTLGSTTDLRADADESGVIDTADLTAWQGAYGNAVGSSAAVPEPSTAWLTLLAYGYLSTAARRR